MVKIKKENKLKTALLENKSLIISQLKNEWEEAEKAFEQKKRKEKLIEFAKDAGLVAGKGLLAFLFIGGVLTVAVVAPNVFSAFGRLMKHRKYFKKEQFNKNKYYLKRHGLIKIKKIDQDTFEMSLTKRGEDKMLGDFFKSMRIQKSEKSDEYWRVVMFDIPNKHKWTRDIFRHKLKEMGFYQLQESVFITPYPCEKEIKLIVSALNISSFVYLIKTKDFSGDKELEKAFG